MLNTGKKSPNSSWEEENIYIHSKPPIKKKPTNFYNPSQQVLL